MANKKIRDSSSGDDPKKMLQAIKETLSNGRVPKGAVISADEETQIIFNEILAEIVATRKFALAIAEGDLSQNPDVKGYMAGSLKTLQSNLRHLTWQTRQIADGDFSQRVHFMGEFSDSFNAMVEHLSEEKTGTIKREEEERLTYERFKTLLKVSLMRDASDTELSQYIMQAACRMTGSTLAFIGTMSPDESAMDIISWSKSAMQDCRVALSPIQLPIKTAGIWADAVRTRRIKIVNDYSAPHPGKKGLPEGHVIITRFLSLPILENGKVVMVAAVANKPQDYDEADVTRLTLLMQGVWGNLKRRRGEEALHRQAEIIDQTHDSIITTDMDGRVTSWNRGAERLYGYTAQESLGRDISFIYPEAEQKSLKSYVIVPLKKKGSHEAEVRVQRKSGEFFYAHLSLTLQKDEAGNAFGIVGYSLDITERKQAEEAIRTAVKLNQLIDSMSVSEAMTYALNEAERLTDSRIGFFHFVNPDEKTIQLVAWSTETRKHCYVPKKPERHYPVSKAGVWMDCLRERKPIIHNDYAGMINKKGLPEGHVPMTREIVVPIFEENRIVAIIGVGNKATNYHEKDINVLALLAKNAWTLIRRKQTEEALTGSEYRFREANNKLNMLSSITRHDILNMIMVIRGYLELSEDLEKDPLLQGYIEKEKDAVDVIQHQIEFTRYYQDIGLKEPMWNNAGKLADTAAKILNPEEIKFENLLNGIEILADPLIEKVFYNLIENSLRHGGHVTSIGFSYLEKEDGLVISYRDNGAGISGKDRERLFERGFGKNTGLGLFLSREILSITNIKITENGKEGEGVNFEITVPKDSFRFINE